MNTYLIFAISAAWFAFGWTANDWRLGEKAARAEVAAATLSRNALEAERALETARQKASDAEAAATSYRLRAERAKSEQVEIEVIRYVESPDAGQCVLPDGWVRAHDSAAGRVRPDAGASGGADASREGVGDDQALIVVTRNYNMCREELARLEQWQKWWEAVRDAH